MKGLLNTCLLVVYVILMLVLGSLAGYGIKYLTHIDSFELGKQIVGLKERMHTGSWGGFYVGDGVLLCRTEYACIHETGHWKDESLGWISTTPEFKKALDSYIAECIQTGDSGELSYYCNLQRFPGIYGNPIDSWGGYSEAYAEIYKYNVHSNYPLPRIFIEFY